MHPSGEVRGANLALDQTGELLTSDMLLEWGLGGPLFLFLEQYIERQTLFAVICSFWGGIMLAIVWLSILIFRALAALNISLKFWMDLPCIDFLFRSCWVSVVVISSLYQSVCCGFKRARKSP